MNLQDLVVMVLPWSKSCPSGEELLVRLACLPSKQSRCKYQKTEKPLK